MWKEFKEFIAQGNVLGLAVAVILGAAFGLVVVSFTNDVLMQLIAAVVGQVDFTRLSFELNGTPIRYGAFLTALINFLIVSFALFLTVKGANALQRKKKEEAPAVPTHDEVELSLLREIRDAVSARPVRQG